MSRKGMAARPSLGDRRGDHFDERPAAPSPALPPQMLPVREAGRLLQPRHAGPTRGRPYPLLFVIG